MKARNPKGKSRGNPYAYMPLPSSPKSYLLLYLKAKLPQWMSKDQAIEAITELYILRDAEKSLQEHSQREKERELLQRQNEALGLMSLPEE